MKTNTSLLVIACIATGLTACASTSNNTNTSAPKIGMANPASTFCVEQGGELSIRKSADGGEVGYCKLPSGQKIEEWEFFRKSQKQ